MKYGSALRDMSAAPVLLGLVIGVAITLLTLGIAGTFGGSDAPAVLPPTLVPTVAADEPLPTIEAPRILAQGPTPAAESSPSIRPSRQQFATCVGDTYTTVAVIAQGQGSIDLGERGTASLRDFFDTEAIAGYAVDRCQELAPESRTANPVRCLLDEATYFARLYWGVDGGGVARSLGGRYALAVCQPTAPQ